ncbi:hypothetical protein HH303_08365 [Rhodospirillaceae bacterium KN72]|uniref:Oxidoreductase molybdopterin-binding domain-containing protein n=1 Tax=Pacificispira spongiicola TaxID=2729598 RepID=A0A7Y0DZK7_9PROT|nr:hypothetical protein [Pacificispira spongiicola]NMM44490.1 hypothetical protein [Pacificispira spongiicola]
MKSMLAGLSACTLFAVSLMVSAPSMAQGLPDPVGPVILTVDGAIAVTNADDEARFDKAMLQALDETVLKTKSPWIDGEASTFIGTKISAILTAVGARKATLSLTALDGYAVDIPYSDIEDMDPILSWERNGTPLTVRDRGPLWVTYPIDKIPADEAAKYSARWIWQVARISVQE